VWVSDAAGESATLLFYIMTGLYFRPHAQNPYFAINDDDIDLQVCEVRACHVTGAAAAAAAAAAMCGYVSWSYNWQGIEKWACDPLQELRETA
jgi:hypothetical protein